MTNGTIGMSLLRVTSRRKKVQLEKNTMEGDRSDGSAITVELRKQLKKLSRIQKVSILVNKGT
eukprot:10733648-Heterocapsa_arctica.AAC.1